MGTIKPWIAWVLAGDAVTLCLQFEQHPQVAEKQMTNYEGQQQISMYCPGRPPSNLACCPAALAQPPASVCLLISTSQLLPVWFVWVITTAAINAGFRSMVVFLNRIQPEPQPDSRASLTTSGLCLLMQQVETTPYGELKDRKETAKFAFFVWSLGPKIK